jgi:transcriptional regulator with XRE-family HTH domain
MPIPPRRAEKAGTRSLSEVLARNVRQVRSLCRLSQDDVAERMTALGHAWSRQTTSDVERGLRNVTIDELLGLALVLGESIGHLLDPAGNLPVPDFRTAIDPGDPDLPYRGPQNVDDAWPKELAGTTGIGIHRDALQALIEGRLALRLTWEDGPIGIEIQPFVSDLDDFMKIVNEFRRRGREREEGQNEGDDLEARQDMDLPVPGDEGR